MPDYAKKVGLPSRHRGGSAPKPRPGPGRRGGRTRHIGLFIPTHLELGRSILKALGACALSRPDWVLWAIPEGWRQAGEKLPVVLDAVVAFMAHPESADWFAPWSPRVINLSSRFAFRGFSRVVTDDAAVGRIAASHLRDRGYRQFVAASLGTDFGKRRADAFLAALAGSGVPAGSRAWLEAAQLEHARGGRRGIERALGGLQLPAAVFADSDWLAQRIRRACLLRGLTVPGDISILGVDNDPVLSQLGSPPLSSVALDGRGIAEAVFNLLDSGFRTGKWPIREVLVPPLGVIERRSTEAAASDDPIVRRANAWISDHAVMGKGVPELCEALGITRRTLDRRFEANGGPSPLDLILRRRVEHARRMLRETGEKIDEVAYRSGFGTARSLARSFVAAEGISPSAYRDRFAR